MSEINSIANGSFVLGQTSATNFIAGPGIKIDEPSAGTVRIGNDETVLWSGSPSTTVTSVNLSESWKNFQTIKLYGITEGGVVYSEFDTDDMTNNSNKEASLSNGGFYTWNSNSFYVNITIPCKFNNELTVSSTSARYVGRWSNSWQTKETNSSKNILTKIVGINRISGSNA